MAVTALSLVGAICVLGVHHEPPNRPVRGWRRRLILNCLPRYFCMDPLDGPGGRVSDNGVDPVPPSEDGESPTSGRACAVTILKGEKEDKLRREWQLCARVVNRTHFICFSVLIVAVTVIFLVTLTVF